MNINLQPGQRVRFIGNDDLHRGRTGTVAAHWDDKTIVVNLDATAKQPAHGCIFVDYPDSAFEKLAEGQ